MISLHSLSLINFLSHSETELHFKDGSRVLIDGKSGAGKSSIADAVIWCLYGIGRVDNRSLIKNGEQSAEVILVLNDADGKKKISRKITLSGKHTLSVETSDDGEEWLPIPVVGIKPTQEWIEKEFLHASYELFINSIAYPQDNTDNFVKQSANKRKDLLLEIAGIGNYDEYYTKAHKAIESREEELGRITGELASKDDVIKKAEQASIDIIVEKDIFDKITAEKTIVDSSIALIKDKKDKLLSSYSKLTSAEQSLNDVKDRMKATQAEIDRINGRIASIKGLDLSGADECLKKIEELKSKIFSAEVQESLVSEYDKKMYALMVSKPSEIDYDEDIKSLQARLREMELMPDMKCQKCGEPIPSFVDQLKGQKNILESQILAKINAKIESERSLQEYTKKIEELGKRPESKAEEIKTDKVLLVELETKSKTFDSARAAMSTIEELNATLSVHVITLEKYQKDSTIMESQYLTAKTEHESIKVDAADSVMQEPVLNDKLRQLAYSLEVMNRNIAEKNVIIKMAEDAKISIVSLKENEKKLRDEVVSLKLVKDAFGSKGIKTVAIDFFVPRLEQKINEILSQLSDFKVEINTQKGSTDGESQIEGLFINVCDPHGKEMEFNAYSGGEKLKVIVAISEALASLQNISFRVLDEMFIGLDGESIDSFVEVLDKVQNRFSQLLVISHLQNIKDLFTEKIEIIKRNGDSVVDN